MASLTAAKQNNSSSNENNAVVLRQNNSPVQKTLSQSGMTTGNLQQQQHQLQQSPRNTSSISSANSCGYVHFGLADVPKHLQDGEKFIKWDEDSGVGTPVTCRVDAKGFYLNWVDQNNEMDLLDIATIRDVRTGQYAKKPRDTKLRQIVTMGSQDTLEEKTVTVCYGSDFVNLMFVNFCCTRKDIAQITELDTSEIIEEIVQTPKPKRRKQTDTSEEIFKMAIRELNKEDDEYLIMAKAYAVKLKKMTEEQRLYADQLIHQILLEGQLSQLSRCTTVSIQRELPRPPSSQTYSRPSSSESSYLVQPAECLIVIPTVSPEAYSYRSNSDSDSCSAIQTFITEYNDV